MHRGPRHRLSGHSSSRATVAIDAFTLDVAQMRGGRTWPSIRQIDQPCLDRHAPGIGGQRATGEARRDVAASQPGARPLAGLADGLAEFSAGLVGLAQHLVDEGVAAPFWRARPYLETIVVVFPHASLPSKASVAGRVKHAASPMSLRHCALHDTLLPPGACRVTPTCRLPLGEPACRDLISCLPPLPCPLAVDAGGPAAVHSAQRLRWRALPRPQAGRVQGKTCTWERRAGGGASAARAHPRCRCDDTGTPGRTTARMARRSAVSRRPSSTRLRPNRMRDADHGGCGNRPEIPAVK